MLATYNVHGCVGGDRRTDPGRTAAVLEELGADVLALQEVPLGEADAPLARGRLFEGLEGHVLVSQPTVRHRGVRFGNVLLSRLPVHSRALHDLSVPSFEPRGAIDVRLELPAAGGARTLRVVATHLGLTAAQRRLQFDALLAHLGRGPEGPLCVLGDFNEWRRRSPSVARMEALVGPAPRRRSFPTWRPLLALDRVWVRPAAALCALRVHRSALAAAASDHYPVVATLSLSSCGEPGSARDRRSADSITPTCE